MAKEIFSIAAVFGY